MPDNLLRAEVYSQATSTKAQVEEIGADKAALGCTEVTVFGDSDKQQWILVYLLPTPGN